MIDLASCEPFDPAFDASRFVLWRCGTDVRMSLNEPHVARVRRALALRGVRAAVAHGYVPPPVLFDVSARPRPLRAYASDRSLTRWIKG